jgi:hypothetical protein
MEWGEGLTTSNTGIRGIHIETQMHRPRQSRINMFERHGDDLADPVLVDVVHCEAFDFVVAKNPFFGGVDVAKANVDAVGRRRLTRWREGRRRGLVE